MLEQKNIKCFYCFSGEQAIFEVKKRKEQSDCCKDFKLILMDIDMPEMDGY